MHPFLDHPGPIAFAHRGGAGDAPENTLVASISPSRSGTGTSRLMPTSRATECWSRFTTTGWTGSPIAQARSPHSISARWRRPTPVAPSRSEAMGSRSPRLEDLLARWPEVRVHIDPKADACVVPLAALLDRLSAWDRGLHLIAAGGRNGELGRGRACTSMGPHAVAPARAAATVGRMPRLCADCLQVPTHRGGVQIVTERFVAAAHRAGLPVHVWTINDGPAMDRLLDLGVDGINDRPAPAAPRRTPPPLASGPILDRSFPTGVAIPHSLCRRGSPYPRARAVAPHSAPPGAAASVVAVPSRGDELKQEVAGLSRSRRDRATGERADRRGAVCRHRGGGRDRGRGRGSSGCRSRGRASGRGDPRCAPGVVRKRQAASGKRRRCWLMPLARSSACARAAGSGRWRSLRRSWGGCWRVGGEARVDGRGDALASAAEPGHRA